MNYGFEEKPHRLTRFLGFAAAALAGVFAGFLAELVATAFTDTLAAALPSLSAVARVALYLFLSAIPAAIFAALARSRRATGSSRVLGATALVILLLLVVGELSRVVVLERSHNPFYIVPERRPDKS